MRGKLRIRKFPDADGGNAQASNPTRSGQPVCRWCRSEQARAALLLDFQVTQWRRKGNAVATDEQLERITKVPKREFMRRGINQHTLEKICKRKTSGQTCAVLRVLEDYENSGSSLPKRRFWRVK